MDSLVLGIVFSVNKLSRSLTSVCSEEEDQLEWTWAVRTGTRESDLLGKRSAVKQMSLIESPSRPVGGDWVCHMTSAL